MKKIIILFIALLTAESLSAQLPEFPDINYKQFERKALRNVRRRHDVSFNRKAHYDFRYIFLAEPISIDAIMKATCDDEFLAAIQIHSSRYDKFASISNAIISDGDGNAQWIAGQNHAVPYPESWNLAEVIETAELEFVFLFPQSDCDYFGYKDRRVFLIEQNGDGNFELSALGDRIAAFGLQDGCFTRYLAREIAKDEVSTETNQVASFQGGDLNSFRSWVYERVKLPHNNQTDTEVVVSFAIIEDGSLTDIKILSEPNKPFDDEVIGVLRQSPKWTPAYGHYAPKRTTYIVPFHFGNQK